MDQKDNAKAFRAMHHAPELLVLPNAWDAVSAKVLQQAGFPAIATASASISWTLGVRDGEGLTRQEMVDAVLVIADAVDVPVSADIEMGFGDTPGEVFETVTKVIAAGAVGVNIEDGMAGAQRPIKTMQARIAAVKSAGEAAGVPIVINARVDAYLQGRSGDETYADTLARAAAWFEAGADCVFVPGAKDRDLIARLAADIDGPLNIIVMDETTLSVAELQSLGVARVSTGPRLMQAVIGSLQQAARSIREDGDFRFLKGAAGFAEINALF